jgi:RNA polymerase sigma-70 factor (ECF subfamily)
MRESLKDPKEFERAYREHRGAAFAAAVHVLHDSAAAEDVVQDSFMHLWNRPDSFDHRRGSLRGYIAMVARSRAIDRRRAQAAQQSTAERFTARLGREPEPGLAERAIERERSARLVSVLEGLPPSQREALLLAFGGGLTMSEVAAAVGVPLGTVKSRVRLGLAKLRELAEGVA